MKVAYFAEFIKKGLSEMDSKSKWKPLMKSWLLLPFFIFTLIKNLLQRCNIISTQKPILILLSLIITNLVLVILLPMLLVMFIIKKIVQTIIKIEEPLFQSMLTSSDVIWCVDDNTRGVISILMIVESNTIGLEVYKTFKKLFHKAWKEHMKIHCTREKKYGYYYWKNLPSYNEHDFITTFDKYNSIEEWNAFMNITASAPMPLNDKGAFYMVVGTKELNWKVSKEVGSYQYPIFVRFHHSVGDGASVVNFMTTQFCYNGVDNVTKYFEGFNALVMKKMSNQHKKTCVLDGIRKIVHADFKFMAIADSFDASLVTTKMLKENGYLLYFSEQNQKISMKIDCIRKKYNLTFTKLMLGLVQESMSQLYNQQVIENSNNVSTILTCMTAMLKSFEIEDNIAFSNDGHPIVILNNSFSMGLYKNSIQNVASQRLNPSNFAKLFLENVNVLSKELDLLNKSVDYQFINWMIEFVCASLPGFLISHLINLHKNTFVITSLPGLKERQQIINPNPKIHIWLADLMYWLPQYKTAGLGLMLSKYCGELKLTFTCNTAYIEEKDDAELFIKNILMNIDILYKTIGEKEQLSL